jgi:hypothetical protein
LIWWQRQESAKMLLKWVFLFAIAYIAYRYWARVSVSRAPAQRPPHIEQMLECAYCGIRFPESEAVRNEDRFFCGEQHYASWKQNH